MRAQSTVARRCDGRQPGRGTWSNEGPRGRKQQRCGGRARPSPEAGGLRHHERRKRGSFADSFDFWKGGRLGPPLERRDAERVGRTISVQPSPRKLDSFRWSGEEQRKEKERGCDESFFPSLARPGCLFAMPPGFEESACLLSIAFNIHSRNFSSR